MMHFELRDPNRRLLADSGRGRDDVRLKRVALEHRTKASAVLSALRRPCRGQELLRCWDAVWSRQEPQSL